MIAEQVLRGGVPAVRQAVDKMNEQAKAEGRPQIKPEPLLAVAERLLPALRSAEWRDRAEAAVADLDELDLRDLRSVVVAAESGAKDDEARALAAQLREGLAHRVEKEQSAWLAEIAETLADGRVVRALRLSSRPPKAGAPLPAELATKLTEAASGALTADTVTERWATVLDALSFSPVRLTVSPASKPAEPTAELVAAITRVATRLPKVAEAFGIEAPAEAGRRRGARPGGKRGGKTSERPARTSATGGGTSSPPIPPPPPVPSAPVAPQVDGHPNEPVSEPVSEPASEPASAAPSPDTPEPVVEPSPASQPDASSAPLEVADATASTPDPASAEAADLTD